MAGSFLRMSKVPGPIVKLYMHIPWYIKLFYRIQGNEPEKYIDRLYENSGYPAAEKEDVLKDMVHEFWFHGVQFDEYFLYDFYKKPEEYKRSFVNGTEEYGVWNRFNPHIKISDVLNKYNFYLTYGGKYYNRKLIKCEKEADFPEFLSMARELGKIVMKPIDGIQGAAIEIQDFTDASDDEIRRAFDDFLKKDAFLAEEFLIQDPRMAAFNESSVNTVRILTIVTGAPGNYHVEVFYPCMRMGRAGSVVDNPLASGGLYCQIDAESGALYPLARGIDAVGYTAHPDSGAQFEGFVIPDWEEAKAKACELALVRPERRMIGWDFALTDKGWTVIEGNIFPALTLQQACDRIGKKEALNELLKK